MMALVGTFTFEFEVSLPLLAEKTFHGNATTYGLLIGSLGAGAVAGGLYAPRTARTGVRRLTRIAVAYGLAMALLAVVPAVWSAVIACVLVGVASILLGAVACAAAAVIGRWPAGKRRPRVPH